jgi:hypothetical protein
VAGVFALLQIATNVFRLGSEPFFELSSKAIILEGGGAIRMRPSVFVYEPRYFAVATLPHPKIRGPARGRRGSVVLRCWTKRLLPLLPFSQRPCRAHAANPEGVHSLRCNRPSWSRRQVDQARLPANHGGGCAAVHAEPMIRASWMRLDQEPRCGRVSRYLAEPQPGSAMHNRPAKHAREKQSARICRPPTR